MKRFISLFLIVLLALLFAGCSVQKRISGVVDKVCDMPADDRSLMRDAIDTATYPHQIRINCDGD